MKEITSYQVRLTNRMIDAMPDGDIQLIDILTAGTMFVANAITQTKDCSLTFEKAFQLVSKAVIDIISDNKKGGSDEND